jgi:uncharacterized protein YdaU (DUF1376 family)
MSDIWFPFYIGDYLGDTMHLTTEEHGAYILLIMYYWKNNGAIENNKNLLKNITKISQKKLQNVLTLFSEKEGYLHHKRIDEELLKAQSKSQKAKESAEARWQKEHDANASPKHMLQPYSSQSQSEVTNVTKKTKAKKVLDFDWKNFNTPEWVERRLWDGLMEIRIRKGAEQTELALSSLLSKLDKLRGKGHDPTALLERAIENSWKTIYEPKENYENTSRITTQNRGFSGGRKSRTEALAEQLYELNAEVDRNASNP